LPANHFDDAMDFSEYLISTGCVKFGRFELKSGRLSPYFINFGILGDGEKLDAVGVYFADYIKGKCKCDLIFGPAYKGIPIAIATSIAYSGKYSPIEWAFDRKEAKSHGDVGIIVGSQIPGKRVIIVDDVFTTGGTKVNAVELLRVQGAKSIEILVGVDREEKGEKENAVEEFENNTGVKVHSLAKISELYSKMKKNGMIPKETEKLYEEYRKLYG